MENFNTGTYDMYKDISARTNGEIYIGVIGAVRTGKSSFIKRFMELMVLPFMEDENSRQRAVDEMPQAAQGKTDNRAEVYSKRCCKNPAGRRYRSKSEAD